MRERTDKNYKRSIQEFPERTKKLEGRNVFNKIENSPELKYFKMKGPNQ